MISRIMTHHLAQSVDATAARGHRHRDAHHGAAPPATPYVESAADAFDPLPHAGDAEMRLDTVLGDADAIVFDADVEVSACHTAGDGHGRRVGVTRDVRQRFLNDAKDGSVAFAVATERLQRELQRDATAAPAREFLRLPF